MITFNEWEKSIVGVTERYLSWRKKRRLAKKEKQKKRNPILDWMDAILSAVVIVLVINQYFLQAYQIPSASMEPTLLITDRIFVNKLVYGPELAPGIVKLPGFGNPTRGDIIIFESPEYLPRRSPIIGPVLMDVIQRVVYMVTLSLVDIDRDENGQPKHHFLIKRAIGIGGDRIRMRDGEVEILTPGETEWKQEAVLKKELGFTYPDVRMYTPEDYADFRAAGVGVAYKKAGLPTTAAQDAAISKYYMVSKDAQGNLKVDAKVADDGIEYELWSVRTMSQMDPSNQADLVDWQIYRNGWYINRNSIFPMGDNRDNSRDARYFGQVKLSKVLGKASFRYWPLSRFGLVR